MYKNSFCTFFPPSKIRLIQAWELFFIKEFSYYEKYNITLFKASIKAFVDKDGVTSKQSLKVYGFLWHKKASFEIRKHETFEKVEYIKYSFKRFKEMEFEYSNQSFYT